MADFKSAWLYTLQNEGVSYTDDPDDPGRKTHFGITERLLKEHQSHCTVNCPVRTTQIGDLNLAGAMHVAEKEFWKFDSLPLAMQPAANKMFDILFQFGPGGIAIIQRAINTCLPKTPIVVDTRWGPQTASKLLECQPEQLLAALCSEMSDYYCGVNRARLLKALPDQYHEAVDKALKYAKGWGRRAGRRP